jgi:type IV pilus biogenesis protein CpaD/CtpE
MHAFYPRPVRSPLVFTKLVLASALLLVGCGQTTQVRPAPTVITVPKTIYVPIPMSLTKHCDIAVPSNATALEAYNIAKLRGLSLQDCNAQLDTIHGIQGTEVSPVK